MNEKITPLELAMLIDIYGSDSVDEILSSPTYQTEFEKWANHIEEDFANKHPKMEYFFNLYI